MAFVVIALPSSWAGGSVWGQIDGVTQAFLLGSLIAFAEAYQAIGRSRISPALLWFGAGTTCCTLALLTKQLSIFSVPWLLLAAMVCFGQIVCRWKWRGAGSAIATLVVVLGACTLLDRAATVPRGFGGSSLLYVWFGGGSEHDHLLAANGFNLWILLGRDMSSSSRVPFWKFAFGSGLADLTPNQCGKVLFLMASAVLLILFVRTQGGLGWLRRLFVPLTNGERLRFMTSLVFAVGLENLVSNVVLAGTHERYLYHGYPMLFLACLCLWQRPRVLGWRPLALLLVGAACYGGFVYSTIAQLPWFLFPLRRHEFLATLHLVLLAVMIDAFLSLKRYMSRRMG